MPAQTAVVPAVPLSDQLELGGFRFAPASGAISATSRNWIGRRCMSATSARSTCRTNPPPNLEALLGPRGLEHSSGLMEPGSIVGDWRLWVNDSDPLTAD